MPIKRRFWREQERELERELMTWLWTGKDKWIGRYHYQIVRNQTDTGWQAHCKDHNTSEILWESDTFGTEQEAKEDAERHYKETK